MRLTIHRLAPAALVVCALALPATASATSTAKAVKAAKASGVAYLKSLQSANGSFGTDWVLDSLAAARTAAADVKLTEGSTDARTYYRELVGDPTTWPGGVNPSVTEFERVALTLYAGGIDPARVSKRQNLIAQIASRYLPANPGYYGTTSNFTGAVFALLALTDTPAHGKAPRAPQALLGKTIAVLRANQHNDGGWNFERAEGNPTKLAEPSEPDETGAAIAGLCTAGVPVGDPAVANAVAYLEAALVSATGGFTAPFGANTDSNAWAVQGLDACGVAPQGPGFTSPASKTPIDYLIAQQLAGGGFRFEPAETEANEYSTQDAVRSLAGAGFTVKAPKPKSGPRVLAASGFEAGVQSPLALVIDNGSPTLKVCSVSVAPSSPTTTLAAVLETAAGNSTPAGCVTSVAPASGNGAITQVNGSSATGATSWKVSIDGAKEKAAKRSTKISLGDTISLRLG